MRQYKSILNVVAATIVVVFFAWMFSYATPDKDYTPNWKPKTAMKYQEVNHD